MDTTTHWSTEQERTIYDAAGVDPEDQDEQTRSIVSWLAGWDDHTVNGVVKLLAGARVRAVLDTERAVADVMEAEEQRATRFRFGVIRDGEPAIISASGDAEGEVDG